MCGCAPTGHRGGGATAVLSAWRRNSSQIGYFLQYKTIKKLQRSRAINNHKTGMATGDSGVFVQPQFYRKCELGQKAIQCDKCGWEQSGRADSHTRTMLLQHKVTLRSD